MTGDAQEALILRHLDGETTLDEVAKVTKLLADDAEFRSRFFACATTITELQEILVMVKTEPSQPKAIAKASVPEKLAPNPPKPQPPEKSATGGSIDFRQIYFNAILGGAGGLVGWLLYSLLNAIGVLSLVNPLMA